MGSNKGIIKHQFKKGQTGNPNGRPRIPIELKDAMARLPDADYVAIVEKLAALAKKGNTRAIELILDRWAGKPHQNLTVETKIIEMLSPGEPKEEEWDG